VWIGTTDGLFSSTPGGSEIGLRLDGRVFDVEVGPEGVTWASTATGVHRIAPTGVATQVHPPDPFSVTGIQVTSLENGGAVLAIPSGIAPLNVVVTPDGRLDDWIQTPFFPTVLTRDSLGTVWLGGAGLTRWDGTMVANLPHLTTADGLVDNAVTALTVDAAGTLWTGTRSGISRYEGSAWLSHTLSPADPFFRDFAIEYLSGSTLDTLYAASGTVWNEDVFSFEGYFYRLSGEWIEPIERSDPPGGSLIAACDAVAAFPGGAWLAVNSRFLARVYGTRVDSTYEVPGRGRIRALLAMEDGNAWAATDSSLLRFNGASWEPVPGQDPVAYSALAGGEDGRILVGTRGNGAFIVDPVTFATEPYGGVEAQFIEQIVGPSRGGYWFRRGYGPGSIPGIRWIGPGPVLDFEALPTFGEPIVDIGSSGDGRTWVLTATHLHVLDLDSFIRHADRLWTAQPVGQGTPFSRSGGALLATPAGLALGGAILPTSSPGMITRRFVDRAGPIVRSALLDSALSSETGHFQIRAADLGTSATTRIWWQLDGGALMEAPGNIVDVTYDLPAGPHSIFARARDGFHNHSSLNQDFVIASTPPQVVLQSPAGGEVRGEVRIMASLDSTRFGSYSVDLREGTNSAWITLHTASVWPEPGAILHRWDTTTEKDGVWTIRVSQTNRLGLIGSALATVVVDNHFPDARITSPAALAATEGGTVYSEGYEPSSGATIFFPPHTFDRDIQVTLAPESHAFPGMALGQAFRLGVEGRAWSKQAVLTLHDSLCCSHRETGLALHREALDGTWTRVGGNAEAGPQRWVAAIADSGLYMLGVLESPAEGSVTPHVELSFAPRVLVRGGAATGVHVAIALEAESSVSVAVYNRAGRRIRTLARNTRAGPGSFVVSWDGRDEQERDAPPGVYLIHFRSINGEKVVERTGTVAVAG
jgi:hypothetical protein